MLNTGGMSHSHSVDKAGISTLEGFGVKVPRAHSFQSGAG